MSELETISEWSEREPDKSEIAPLKIGGVTAFYDFSASDDIPVVIHSEGWGG